MEPLIFRINAMSAVDTDFIMGSVLYPKDIPFYYGRLYAPDYVNCLCPKGKVFDFLVDSTLYIVFKRYYHDKDIVS